MKNSNISWTDHTFNPWIGCTKVSPGCAHCYAATQDEMRFSRTLGGATPENRISHWGKGAPRHRTSEDYWKQPIKWDRMARLAMDFYMAGMADDELRPTIKPYVRPRVFCASLADWLDDEVEIELLRDLLELIRTTPALDWLLLSKRPQNWASRIEGVLKWIESQPGWGDESGGDNTWLPLRNWLADWFVLRIAPKNIWLGTTVEDQQRADERVPILLNIPATIRFLSCEPLLGHVIFKKAIMTCEHCTGAKAYTIVTDNVVGHWGGKFPYRDGARASVYCQNCGWALRSMGRHIDWVIVGGESGPGHTEMSMPAFDDVVKQTLGNYIPLFVKQDSGAKAGQQGRIPDADWARKQFPKVEVLA